MTVRPMTPPPSSTNGSGHPRSYMLPIKRCASCGQSTRSLHPDCARDRLGRLLVVESKQR